jgi:hypothetical protein
MDYKKEFDNHMNGTVLDSVENTATARNFYAIGAKRAEELLLSDPMVWDGRKVWENAPKDAEGIAIIYNGVGRGCATFSNLEGDEPLIAFLPRPKPAWVPNEEGEIVLVSHIFVASLAYYKSGRTFIDGNWLVIDIEHLRPLTPENIGKRWEEINA